jgi:Zinc carboxypeptidase
MRLALAALFLTATALAQQPADTAYTEQIRKSTTEPRFMTELVDHLPASDTVPSPLEHHGYIAGAEGHLTYAEDVHKYMRALEASSPRVKVFSIGNSEEGREMIVVAISHEDTIRNLDRYKTITRQLSDPRGLTDAQARELIAQGKPFYYATGAMHSPETGSPEMLMELAFRLAVEETPFIRAIRDNIVVLLTPVLEVDGRNRQVDLWNYRKANPNVPTPPLLYWGKYVAHDNNRDQIGLTLALSRNVLKTYFEFHPQVMHDLHESVPFLYTSTGTGPYSPALDPLMIDEWHRMAYNEVNEMTRRGLPGVWTHGFYDGWAPNYMLWAATGHNSIGRFYETFGNRWPTTEKRVTRDASSRQWYRPNPPLPVVTWSLRNNINYQQSALLFALSDMAKNREHFLEQFWTLGKRSVAKAANEGPAAWVFDASQKRRGQLRDLMTLLRRHGIEVHTADEAFSMTTNWPPPKDPAKPAEAVKFAKGSFVVRMDQPYSRLADTLLDIQFVRSDERVYDDTGWTLGYLKNVAFHRVVNPDVLKLKMSAWSGAPAPVAPATPLQNNADTDLVKHRFANPGAKMVVARDGVNVELRTPRIAILHTWQRTQEEGWWRLALEELGVPYESISTQDVAVMPNLREKFDVILFPPTNAAPQDIVNGWAPGPALPWKKTALTPNLGVDETDDMRGGMTLTGVDHMRRFVEDGGLLVTTRDTATWAVSYGLARWVSVVPTSKLRAPGTIVNATVTDKKSPVAWGYDETLPLYFAGSPVFRVGIRETPDLPARASGRGGKDDPDVPQGRGYVPPPERPKPAPGDEGFQAPEDAPWAAEHLLPRAEDRPRVIVSFGKADGLLLSGMLDGADELAGKPAVILAPRGKGNVLLMANNPMWRGNTQGQYALVMNAVMLWDQLRDAKTAEK